MGSVFHSIDNQTGYELLTAPADIRIIRLTLANVETSDTTVNVNLFKNLATGQTARITGYNTAIDGGEMLTLTDLILSTGQFLTITTDGAIDVDINYITI